MARTGTKQFEAVGFFLNNIDCLWKIIKILWIFFQAIEDLSFPHTEG